MKRQKGTKAQAVLTPVAPEGIKFELKSQFQRDVVKSIQRNSITVLIGGAGAGKEQPVSESVLTPHGWSVMGNLKPLDYVIGSDGRPTQVTNVYPQGVKDVYTITFADGSKVRCGEDHLWTVSKQRNRPAVTVNTLTLLADYRKSTSGKKPYKYSVAAFAGLQAGASVDYGYALGYLLGNACFTGTQLAVSCHLDIVDEVIDKLSGNLSTPTNVKTTSSSGRQLYYAWRSVHPELCKYKTDNCQLKRILPEHNWLLWDYDSRLELLRGLLDSDGTNGGDFSDGRQRCSFMSTSESLIHLVRDLIRSLGGRCCEPVIEKRSDRYKSGYAAEISFRMPVNPFKIRKWRKGAYFMDCSIVNIVKEDYKEESVCIKVAAADCLYVTSGYKLTHNTLLAAYAGLQLYHKKHISKIAVVRLAREAHYEKIGALPGVLQDKLGFISAPVYDNLELMLPRTKIDQMVGNNDIEILPISFLRGRSLHNTYLILEEAQNLPREAILTVLTRIAAGSKIVITCDPDQQDFEQHQSIPWLTQILKDVDDAAIFEMPSNENYRHPIITQILANAKSYKAESELPSPCLKLS